MTAIAQDHLGFMWFGTLDGLCRYDGYEVAVYTHNPADSHSISDNAVWAIREDRFGALWVGTYRKGLNKFDYRTGHFTHYKKVAGDRKSLSHNAVRAIYEDMSGNLWVGTNGGGLDRLDRQTGGFTHYRHAAEDSGGLSDNRIMSIQEDASGVLWIGTFGGGLNGLDRERRAVSRAQHGTGDGAGKSQGEIWAICEDINGDLWLGTSEGLTRFDNAIILDAVLAEPGLKFKGMVKIEGRVEYKLNAIANQDPTTVEFNLATNAQLFPLYVLSNPDDQATCGWWVSDASHHVVYLSDKGVGSLSRNYKIEGRNDIYLRLQFQITQKNIQVTGMSLRVRPRAADPM